jgi:hypothetical protein
MAVTSFHLEVTVAFLARWWYCLPVTIHYSCPSLVLGYQWRSFFCACHYIVFMVVFFYVSSEKSFGYLVVYPSVINILEIKKHL